MAERKETVVDLFGVPIVPGVYLAYPVCVRRGAGISVGKVIGFTNEKVKLRGVSTAFGRRERLSKPSYLNFPERAVVLPEAVVPEDIRRLLHDS